MGDGKYRSNIDEFLRETEWDVPPGSVKARMDVVLRYFCAHVPPFELDRPADLALAGGRRVAFRPSHGRWTMLMSWMQAVVFEKPVDTCFPIPQGARLVAFRWKPLQGKHSFGNFYVQVQQGAESNSGLGIPSTQRFPISYLARRTFTTLLTAAGDAFLGWIDPAKYPLSYSHGGRRQLFIWRPELVLDPILEAEAGEKKR